MKKISCCLLISLLLQQFITAQDKQLTDSVKTIDEVVITAFEQNRVVSNGTIVKTLNSKGSDRYNKTSLVNGFNTIAGVRMEERSPGSYRINIRGSSLRSPFGVRNVKTYWNGIPVTDAGGNTYFNQFAFNNFSSIEIIKGPAGSLYGSGTGGVLLIHSLGNSWDPGLKFEYVTGSYNLQNILASAGFGNNNARNLVTYAHNQSNGYRNHTISKKDNVSFVTQLNVSDKQKLTGSILYNNLFYETPGGLNETQFLTDPKQARPAAGAFAGSEAKKAAIFQQNFTIGINHQYDFTAELKNSTTIYGSFNQVKNPSIRNYERRNEPGFGGRTSFIYERKLNETRIQFVAGTELQYAFFNTRVSDNKNGRPDTLQTNDDIQYATTSIFAQGDINVKNQWIITAGISMNKTKVDFTRLNSYPVMQQGRTYKNEFSPRIALQKIFNNNATVFSSISKGFSPPTISELLPSTGVISTGLEAEQGVNYEFGGRFSLLKKRLRIELTGFYFKLNNALVTRKDSANADYFVNAGNTRQKGFEISADYITGIYRSILEVVMIRSAYTFSDFKYGNFKKGINDFSRKNLPSVPKNTISVIADLEFKKGIYVNTGFLLAGRIFLNDANTAFADAYHLLGCRAGWKPGLKRKIGFNIYIGIENLLNETYSLGNDINAAAGRYYNAAPARNYYVGIAFQLDHAVKKNSLDLKMP